MSCQDYPLNSSANLLAFLLTGRRFMEAFFVNPSISPSLQFVVNYLPYWKLVKSTLRLFFRVIFLGIYAVVGALSPIFSLMVIKSWISFSISSCNSPIWHSFFKFSLKSCYFLLAMNSSDDLIGIVVLLFIIIKLPSSSSFFSFSVILC